MPVTGAQPWLGPGALPVATPCSWGPLQAMGPPDGAQCRCEQLELGATALPSARLETRTKESMELACWQVPSAKPVCL